MKPRGAAVLPLVYLAVGGGSVLVAGLVLAIGEPITWLLVAAPVSVLAFAVVHVVVAVASRRAADTHSGARSSRSLTGVFGVAPRPLMVAAGLVFASGWLVGVVAMAGASAGVSHDDGPPSCRYYLNNHGARTCITRDKYVAAQASEQALVFGLLGAALGACGALTIGRPAESATEDQRSRAAMP